MQETGFSTHTEVPNSWRDTTRVAAANPELWEGILSANRTEIRAAMDRWLVELHRLRAQLDTEAPLLNVLDASVLSQLRREMDPQLRRDPENEA